MFFGSSASRLLLSEVDADPSASCPGGGDRIINCTTESTSGVVLLQNITVCAAGRNEIIYDIGFLDENGVFVPLAIGVFTTDITVAPGSAAVFRLVLRNSAVQRTYSQVSSAVGVELQDQGRNVITVFFIVYFEIAFKLCLFIFSNACLGCPRLNCSRSVGY
jgi:hypothetical protein